MEIAATAIVILLIYVALAVAAVRRQIAYIAHELADLRESLEASGAAWVEPSEGDD